MKNTVKTHLDELAKKTSELREKSFEADELREQNN
jgi:hypothetical protein